MLLLKKLYIPVCMFLPLSILAKEHTQLEKIGEIRSSNTDNSTPGNGMVKVFGMPMSFNCFKNNKDPKNIKFGNLSGQINFSRSVSQKDLSSVLNISAGAEISYAWFSATANASYLKDITDSRYTDNFTFIQTYSADASYELPDDYGIDLLNQTAAKALAQKKFGQICGDSFISNSKAGATLITTVTLNFNSAQDKTEFDTKFKGNISGIASITQEFKNAVTKSGISATLSVKAIQNGGDPSKLAQIFGKPSETGYPISNCSKENIQECNKIIDNIISYAQGEFQNGLDLSNPQSLYYFNPSSEKYSTFGINYIPENLSPLTKSAIAKLTKQYQSDFEDKIYLSKYISYLISKPELRPIIPVALPGEIKTLESKIEQLMEHSSNALTYCFNEEANHKCPAFVEEVNIAHQQFANEGNLRKIYSMKSIIQAETFNQAKYLFLPASIYNSVPTQANNFGFDPKTEKISGEYFVKAVFQDDGTFWHHCKINFNPNIANNKAISEVNLQLGEKPIEILCDFDPQRFRIISSAQLNQIGYANPLKYDFSYSLYDFFGGSRFNGEIKSMKMFNTYEYNPI
ncbi:hypothetical protein [Fluviispira vulneris]|uniref:hypothetical protein n=1 Tax=Fluviispira vulneris TaxID=2763012 RepID=UPI0016467BCA|nr:hypothetical protein [Fluviispira vulneris]